MLQLLKGGVRAAIEELNLPTLARAERRKDRGGLPERDPGVDAVIDAGIEWLYRAQDQSTTHDGGVARDYSLMRGAWATSYPETTGYIVPTLLEHARRSGQAQSRERARRMLDWFAKIQLPGGGFQGGRIDSTPVVPVTFNTGQILIGLAAGAKEFGSYHQQMRQAADWLANSLDADGCWRKHPTPFAGPGEKAYETHVSWGLFEAARVEPDHGWQQAALSNVRWALTKQQANGWLASCCLDDPTRPLTHTLGYALRGIIEAYRFSNDETLLQAARTTADALLAQLREDGYLAGRFYSDWRPAVEWVCLTGLVQIAACWLDLYRFTGEQKYRDAGFRANRYVRRSISIDGPPETRGAVKGSFPVDGDYGAYQYLNWAVKFCIDSNMLERDIRAGS